MPQFKAGLLHFLVTDPGQGTSEFWILVFSSEQDAAYSLSWGCEEQRLSQLSLAMKTPLLFTLPHLPPSPERGKCKVTLLALGGHAVWLGGISFAGAACACPLSHRVPLLGLALDTGLTSAPPVPSPSFPVPLMRRQPANTFAVTGILFFHSLQLMVHMAPLKEEGQGLAPPL